MYNKNYNYIALFVLVLLGVDIYSQIADHNTPLWNTDWFYKRIYLAILILFCITAYIWLRYLINAREKKQEYIKRLIETQESALKKVSFELHDSIGQNLLVINNNILRAIQNNKESSLTPQLSEISGLVLETIDEIRTVSSGIYPHHIKKIGLKKSIKAMINKVLGDTGINIEMEIAEIDNVFNNETGLDLYRIIQEAVNNIAKHSNAKNISVKIYLTGKYIITEIYDDGKGFENGKQKKNNLKGFGLFNMYERAKAAGGKFSIESEPGKGTIIIISIPVYLNHK